MILQCAVKKNLPHKHTECSGPREIEWLRASFPSAPRDDTCKNKYIRVSGFTVYVNLRLTSNKDIMLCVLLTLQCVRRLYWPLTKFPKTSRHPFRTIDSIEALAFQHERNERTRGHRDPPAEASLRVST